MSCIARTRQVAGQFIGRLAPLVALAALLLNAALLPATATRSIWRVGSAPNTEERESETPVPQARCDLAAHIASTVRPGERDAARSHASWLGVTSSGGLSRRATDAWRRSPGLTAQSSSRLPLRC